MPNHPDDRLFACWDSEDRTLFIPVARLRRLRWPAWLRWPWRLVA